jgi:hypothetical protein
MGSSLQIFCRKMRADAFRRLSIGDIDTHFFPKHNDRCRLTDSNNLR